MVAAAAIAVTVNNQLASTIANNTERFRGFAALSMHNATEVALKLQCAVKELGCVFCIFMWSSQQSTFFRRIIKRFLTVLDPTAVSFPSACICYLRLAERSACRYYDQPFLENGNRFECADLLSPARENTALEYRHAPFLTGAAQGFTHIQVSLVLFDQLISRLKLESLCTKWCI